MQIRTLEQQNATDDPLQMAVDAGARAIDKLRGLLIGSK